MDANRFNIAVSGLPPPKYGIITALPHEYAAVRAMLESPHDVEVGEGHRSLPYTIGVISTGNDEGHMVVLSLLPIMGNVAAANRVTLLIERFSSVTSVFMVGIAGGVPLPDKSDRHVRLGDIVVSDVYGVIEYGFNKDEGSEEPIYRPRPLSPSASLLQRVRLLQANVLSKIEPPWFEWIDRACMLLGVQRPLPDTDLLSITQVLPDGTEQRVQREHPEDTQRRPNRPRVFTGPIGSSDTLLKNARKRDKLRDAFGVMAVEMEGAGVAQATWLDGKTDYLVIRGICDYCDENKGELWQPYAAIVAAAYLRVLLQSIKGDLLPPSAYTTGDAASRRRQALGLLKDAQDNLNHERVWPELCDHALAALDDVQRVVNEFWLLLEKHSPRSFEMTRLLNERVIRGRHFDNEIADLKLKIGDLRSNYRNQVTAARPRLDAVKQLAQLTSDVHQLFRDAEHTELQMGETEFSIDLQRTKIKATYFVLLENAPTALSSNMLITIIADLNTSIRRIEELRLAGTRESQLMKSITVVIEHLTDARDALSVAFNVQSATDLDTSARMEAYIANITKSRSHLRDAFDYC